MGLHIVDHKTDKTCAAWVVFELLVYHNTYNACKKSKDSIKRPCFDNFIFINELLFYLSV